MTHRHLVVCALVVFAASCNTPQSICEDMQMALDDLLVGCGYAPIELRLDTGEPATCDDVNAVDNPGQLLNECIPWAQEATCEELEATSSFASVGCDFSLLKYYPPDS
jgi:hypothetical protein